MITFVIGLVMVFGKLHKDAQEILSVVLLLAIFLDAFITIPVFLSALATILK